MMKPEITEEGLDKLMACLVAKFDERYPSQSNKIEDCIFCIMNRMECAKEAGLNYEYRGIMRSMYSDAVKELVHRGYLSYTKKPNSSFILTEKGLEKYKNGDSSKHSSTKHWRKILNNNQGLIAALGVAVGFIGALITLLPD